MSSWGCPRLPEGKPLNLRNYMPQNPREQLLLSSPLQTHEVQYWIHLNIFSSVKYRNFCWSISTGVFFFNLGKSIICFCISSPDILSIFAYFATSARELKLRVIHRTLNNMTENETSGGAGLRTFISNNTGTKPV